MIYLIGIIIFTCGITVSIHSGWGVGPWDTVFVGINDVVPLTVGIWSIILQVILLFISAMISQTRPAFESGITIIVRGIILDIWMLVVFPYLHIEPQEMNIWMGLLGLLLLGFGIGLYLVSNLPRTPVDVFMLAIQTRMQWSMKKARLAVEFIAVTLGLLLAGPVGVGTLITAVLLAPMIQFTNDLFTKRLRVSV